MRGGKYWLKFMEAILASGYSSLDLLIRMRFKYSSFDCYYTHMMLTILFGIPAGNV